MKQPLCCPSRPPRTPRRASRAAARRLCGSDPTVLPGGGWMEPPRTYARWTVLLVLAICFQLQKCEVGSDIMNNKNVAEIKGQLYKILDLLGPGPRHNC